ncbi:cytochrome P450 [Mycolicibacterium sp. XJ1819]
MSTDVNSVGAPRITLRELPVVANRTLGWRMLREAGPVVYAEDDFYYLTRRDDVLAALRNPQVFSSKRAFDNMGSPLPLVPIAFDPPEHTRYRKILQPFFSPAILGDMLPALERQASDIIGDLAARGGCNIVDDLAIPYPSQVFLTFFGLPLSERDRMIEWKNAVIALAERPTTEGLDLTPAMEMAAFLTEVISERRATPGDDVISQLLTGHDALDDTEAIGLTFLFVVAGLDTVTAAIGFAMYELACNQQLRHQIRGDEEKIREFIEEIVRLEPPVPTVPRETTADVTIGDVTIPAGSPVRLCLAASNREDGGDELIIDGSTRRHWGYGSGPHRCLGSHLARMELKLLITEWLDRIPEFEPAPGNDSHITYPAGTHTLNELHVRYPVTHR